MGDTGSLALGGALGAIAVATKHEIVLAIVGGLFVVEALSVIIQVAYYKRTKKRVFLMAPIHHHFEKKGWAEPQIVIRFWIVVADPGAGRPRHAEAALAGAQSCGMAPGVRMTRRRMRLTEQLVSLVPPHSGESGRLAGRDDLPTDEDYAEAVAELLAGAPPSGEVWIFAYGSLIWSPGFDYAEERLGTISGWRRSFCVGWVRHLPRHAGAPRDHAGARPGRVLPGRRVPPRAGDDAGEPCAGLSPGASGSLEQGPHAAGSRRAPMRGRSARSPS